MILQTSECAWSNVSLTLLGRKIIGLRGFEIKKSKEKEHLYAAGDEPIDIQSGNTKYEGNVKVLKFEADKLNDAALEAGFADILEVPHTLILITVQYRKLITDPIRTIVVPGVAFTELGVAMEQNAKMTEITLPFMAMRIQHT